jgi:hypothetical protein
MPKRGRPFQKGQSGNPGGRPKGSKTFAIRELVAEALADPSTREAAIREFRRALARTRTVIPSLEFAARVNKEIGQGSGDRSADGVTIVFRSNVDPMKLAAAKSRALPLPALPASNWTNGAH